MSCTNLRRRGLLDRCTLSVPAGMRLLVVSEPEASASMLLRILAGLSHRHGGRVEIAGMRDEWSGRMAYVGPQPGLYRWMTPLQALDLAAGLIGLAPDEAGRRTERALAWVHITDRAAGRPISRGGVPLLQRTAFATALLGDPEVLLLDEPLRAIEARERARLLRLPGARRTIVLASRYPATEAGLVTHIALLRRGRLALLASVDELEAAGVPISQRGVAMLADRRRSHAAGAAAR
ncbi:MAG: ABC transporter ATP-binding protein [Thermoleophilaceae bacterium]